MIQARRFHSNFFFIVPLTQGVLIIILLDFCKNAAFFGGQIENLPLTTTTTTGDGQSIKKFKDPAYLSAQYVYAIWLVLMMIKAIIGFRANLKFNIRWMGKYNLLFGIDTVFEFFHTILGVVFSDTSSLSDLEVVKRYCISFLILLLQCYGFFCTWIHLKWVYAEMPHLLVPTLPAQSLLGLMFPVVVATSPNRFDREPVMTEQHETTTTEPSTDDSEPTPVQPGPTSPPLPPPSLSEAPPTSEAPPIPPVSSRPFDARSLAGMSAITLTPPTSYGSQATHGRSTYSSSATPPTSRDSRSRGGTMEVVVER